MIYTAEVKHMCPVAKGAYHGPAPIPEEGKWVQAKEIKDISGFTHGVGWCAPQQGACKLSLNIKNGVIEEALVETIGCSGMTHSAAMASEILIGKTILEARLGYRMDRKPLLCQCGIHRAHAVLEQGLYGAGLPAHITWAGTDQRTASFLYSTRPFGRLGAKRLVCA